MFIFKRYLYILFPGQLRLAVPLWVNSVDKFCYLGSVLSRNADISDDIARRIGAACAAFGKLEARLWKLRDIKLTTKVAVYKAVVLPTLLHGCESWTLYRHHIHSLDKFHLRCLRHIARIKWQDKVPNTDVLKRCNITGIEAMIMHSQLRWAGHLTRMPDHRIPKIVFYSKLQHGARPRGHPKMRYKDNLKASLLSAGTDTSCWESAASSRTTWRNTCSKGVCSFEEKRIHSVTKKTKQICFCQNCIKFPPILIIFGRKMANDPNICEVHSYSTSSSSLYILCNTPDIQRNGSNKV